MRNLKPRSNSLRTILFGAGLLLLTVIPGCDIIPFSSRTKLVESELPFQTTTSILLATITQTPPQSTIDPPTVTTTSTPPPIPTTIIIDSIISDRDGMIQVYVPEGEFVMGADHSIGYHACQELFMPLGAYNDCFAEAYYDEEPEHMVWLAAYWIDQTEVTNGMYAALLNKAGNKIEWGDPWYDATDPKARLHKDDGVWVVDEGFEDHPVTLVTWYGAHAYCESVGRRLPTEAEWEKAARGIDQLSYPWGNEFDGTKLNFCDGNCEYISNPNFNDGFPMTAPVGSYPQGASPYGVLDMAGNVWEWVFDRYDPDYYELSSYKNPEGPSEEAGENRVMRGGSWVTAGNYTRSTARSSSGATFEEIETGFRCVLSDIP